MSCDSWHIVRASSGESTLSWGTRRRYSRSIAASWLARNPVVNPKISGMVVLHFGTHTESAGSNVVNGSASNASRRPL